MDLKAASQADASANRIAERIQKLWRVGSRDVDESCDRLRERGKEVIELYGFPARPLPDHLLEVIRSTSRQMPSVPARGMLALREAISELMLAEMGVRCDPQSEILITHGGMHAVSIVFRSLLNPGDEVVLFSPTFFYGFTELVSGTPRYVPLMEEEGYRFDVRRLQAAITPRTRLLAFINPGNPTGTVAVEEDLRDVQEVARRHDLWLLVDESYERMLYDNHRHVAAFRAIRSREKCILVRSFTKSFALPLWRVGWIAAPPVLLDQFLKVLEWDSLFCNPLGQGVALAALRGPQDWLEDIPVEFQRNRDAALAILGGQDVISAAKPSAGPFLFINVTRLPVSSKPFADFLLENYGVPTVPGEFFNAPGYIRFHFGGRTEIVVEAANRVVDAAKEALRISG